MKLPHVCDLKKNKRHIIFNSAINKCCYVPLSKVGQTIAEHRSNWGVQARAPLLKKAKRWERRSFSFLLSQSLRVTV